MKVKRRARDIIGNKREILLSKALVNLQPDTLSAPLINHYGTDSIFADRRETKIEALLDLPETLSAVFALRNLDVNRRRISLKGEKSNRNSSTCFRWHSLENKFVKLQQRSELLESVKNRNFGLGLRRT